MVDAEEVGKDLQLRWPYTVQKGRKLFFRQFQVFLSIVPIGILLSRTEDSYFLLTSKI